MCSSDLPSPEIDVLDLLGVPCPINAARAILRLETMSEGELLDVLLDDGEPADNLPPALAEEGHRIMKQTRESVGWRFRVQRG